MKIVDFHGKTVEEALACVENEINATRMAKESNEYEFVTGQGLIRTKIVNLLKGYGIEHSVKLSNHGVIIVVLE